MIGPRYTSFIRVRMYAPLMGGIENPEKKDVRWSRRSAQWSVVVLVVTAT